MKKLFFKLAPWVLFAVFAAEVVAILIPKPEKEYHLQALGRLPALANGRVQPFDSVGRNALLHIRGTAAVPLEEVASWKFWHHPKKLKATEWLMEATLKPALADTRPIFLIHHPDLINELGLRGKGKERSGLFYFSFNELTNCIPQIQREGRQVMGVDDKLRTAYQKQVAKLYSALSLYRRVKNTLQPEDTADFAATLQALREAQPAGMAAIRAQQAGQPADKAAIDRLAGLLQPFDEQNQLASARLIPPPPDAPREAWRNVGEAVFASGVQGIELAPAAGWFARMSTAYAQGKPAEFNQALAEYTHWLRTNAPAEAGKGRAEYFFNNLQAFLHATIMYLCAFLLAAGAMLTLVAWPNGSEMLRRSAFYITLLALAVHTAGLIFRMWLENRPPVTNLYSSAIFIGWAVAVLGVVLERIYRVGIGVAASALVGFVTLIIAHNLAIGGDTMEMMRAVLDSNFWLATHVITITLGYAAMFLAGFLAIIYVLVGFLTPLLGFKLAARNVAKPAAIELETSSAEPGTADFPTLGQALGKMVYAVICFATLFNFIGTVLGGIWADQSWGRFWGWDPKENGALLIVLWCAAILHARWGGWIHERGLMNMAIFGNIVTAFSWFGVNMLGVGLHSYGFMDAAFKWLMIFNVTQAVIIGLGMLPLNLWASFRKQATPVGAPPAARHE